tara:strand:- start:10840 stop:11427 length:588 start_codon:yes stop_codon:yes gene_type:complete
MGNRRLGRRRLYSVEKFGKRIDPEAGPGIVGAITSCRQSRDGHLITTEIAVDMAGAGATLKSGGGDRDVIGVLSGGAAYLTQMTEAKYGVITEIRCVCTEVPDSVADLDIEHGVDGDGAQDGTDGGTSTALIAGITAKGEDTSVAIDDNSAADKYLYICNGASDTAENFATGKLLIYLYGFVEGADGTVGVQLSV